jgi:Single-stranded DNA-binding protein
MNKTIVTIAVIHKGLNGNPAIRYFGEDDSCVSFSVGERYYDAKAENKSAWNTWHLKAFGPLCSRIKKMNMKEGSLISFSGSASTEHWEGQDGKRSRMVITLDDIAYCSIGSKKSQDDKESAEDTEAIQPPPEQAPAPQSSPPQKNSEASSEPEYNLFEDGDLF